MDYRPNFVEQLLVLPVHNPAHAALGGLGGSSVQATNEESLAHRHVCQRQKSPRRNQLRPGVLRAGPIGGPIGGACWGGLLGGPIGGAYLGGGGATPHNISRPQCQTRARALDRSMILARMVHPPLPLQRVVSSIRHITSAAPDRGPDDQDEHAGPKCAVR